MAAKTSASLADPFIRIAVSLFEEVSRQTIALLGILLASLLIVPWLVNDYLLTVLIVVLYFAFTGQAWNIMMGFAGQLSLGHAIYVGLGAYVAAALYVHFPDPWWKRRHDYPIGICSRLGTQTSRTGFDPMNGGTVRMHGQPARYRPRHFFAP